jgi:hypothetical protein
VRMGSHHRPPSSSERRLSTFPSRRRKASLFAAQALIKRIPSLGIMKRALPDATAAALAAFFLFSLAFCCSAGNLARLGASSSSDSSSDSSDSIEDSSGLSQPPRWWGVRLEPIDHLVRG